MTHLIAIEIAKQHNNTLITQKVVCLHKNDKKNSNIYHLLIKNKINDPQNMNKKY